MPTAYTTPIENGIEFNIFIMRCARAMGACILMRDDPLDQPISEQFEPSDYHAKAFVEAKAKLQKLASMDAEEAEHKAASDYVAEVERRNSAITKNDSLRQKYTGMLEKVNAWEPPTADHTGLKTFMIEQLTSSIDFDCDNTYYWERKPKRLTGEEWRIKELAKAAKDIAYHEAENKKEIERTESRNAWIKALRESLGNIAE